MKWKKENNIKSLNDPSIKIDSSHGDLSFSESSPNASNNHAKLMYAHSGGSKVKMEMNSSFKSDDDEDEDDDE